MLSAGRSRDIPPRAKAAHAARNRLRSARDRWAADLDDLHLEQEYAAARSDLKAANAAAAGTMDLCGRCGGTGSLDGYRHVADGVCFRCGGSGLQPFRDLTGVISPKAAAARSARREQRERDAQRAHYTLMHQRAETSPLLVAALLKFGFWEHEQHRQCLQEDDAEAAIICGEHIAQYERDADWPAAPGRRHRRPCVICGKPVDRFEAARLDAKAMVRQRLDRGEAPVAHDRCAPWPTPVPPDERRAYELLETWVGDIDVQLQPLNDWVD